MTVSEDQQRFRTIVALAAAFGLLLFFAFSTRQNDNDSQQNAPRDSSTGVELTRSQLGNQWPLSVSRVSIECAANDAVLIHANGITYGLNGRAVDAGYASIRESSIWLDDPDPDMAAAGIKMSLEPVLNAGLRICGID